MQLIKKSTISLILAFLLSPAFANAYLDIPKDHHNYTEINYLFERNIITGTQNNTLEPKRPVIFAESLKIALRSAKPDYFEGKRLESLKNSPLTFEGIENAHWAFPYYVYASQKKLLPKEIDPERKITRGEGLKLLLESHKIELPENKTKLFADVSPTNSYYPYFAYAFSNNLVLPASTNHYKPDEFVSREEFMVMTYRLIFTDRIATKFQIIPITINCNATFYSDFFDGRNTASGAVFRQNLPTAAHLSLPFGTKIEIISVENKKSVIVEINDRGPFDDRFCLDLSRSAFEKLALPSRGWIPIEYHIL